MLRIFTSLYASIHSIVTNQINPRNGQIYFPFIYTLFIFILINNLIGMVKRCLWIFFLFISNNLTFGPVFAIRAFESGSAGLKIKNKIYSSHSHSYIMSSGFVFFLLGLIPLSFIVAFSGLELAIAVIQAQVFVVLTSSYIKDGLDLH